MNTLFLIFRKIREQVIWRIQVPLRSLYWRMFLNSLGTQTRIYGRVSIAGPHNVSIGMHSTLNEGTIILAADEIRIGNYVRISAGVVIATAGLMYQEPMERRGHASKPIVIEDGVWIGARAVVLGGVRIGKNAVIGAGAVVTKDIPAGQVAVGVPARVRELSLKSRSVSPA